MDSNGPVSSQLDISNLGMDPVGARGMLQTRDGGKLYTLPYLIRSVTLSQPFVGIGSRLSWNRDEGEPS